jgi:uncharacterized protein with GYD domain
MPHYLIQASYGAGAVKAMVATPQDRTGPINEIVTGAGGRVQSIFFALGEYDLIIIAEMPDAASAAAVGLKVGAGGAMSKYQTTALLTPQEAMSAMQKAQQLNYKPPA